METNLSPIDKNLLLLLDPIGRYSPQSWKFYDAKDCKSEILSSPDRNVVIRFPRRNLIDYCIILLMILLGRAQSKRILFVNDGLLSSIFSANNASLYRFFSNNHLPKPKTLKRYLSSFLPLFWRAETRFIVIFNSSQQALINLKSEVLSLESNKFMFFSNAEGKLLLAPPQALKTGQGELVKTTANPDYSSVMSKEFNTVLQLSRKEEKIFGIPLLGKDIEVGGRHFYTEKYVYGESLRERLRTLGGLGDSVQACKLLDKIDDWFWIYHVSCAGNDTALSTLYSHLAPLFSECYGDAGEALLQTGTYMIRQLEKACPVVTPITAHNDLWPGNIVITENGFTVIDWERAIEHRAPFFDYFWMVVSAVFEWIVGITGNHDYSEAMKKFLRSEDDVTCHVFQKMRNFMVRSGIAEEFMPAMLYLLFMELSVQGFQILGRLTKMDRLAFGMLKYYADHMNQMQVAKRLQG